MFEPAGMFPNRRRDRSCSIREALRDEKTDLLVLKDREREQI